MSQTALFSVITVSLNNLSGLQRTYKSLIEQNFQNFEWYVVDGGSTDGTASWLTDNNITHVSEPDQGIYDAMNKGIDATYGPYMIFLNAGDTIAGADILEKIADVIARQSEPDFIYGDSYEADQYKPARHHQNIAYGMFTHHQAMIYCRTAAGNLRYNTRYRIAADYDFTMRFLSQIPDPKNKVIYVHESLCVFEAGGVSQTSACRGRVEQFHIRRTQGYSFIRNASVFMSQWAVWQGRRLCPGLYWWLKKTQRFSLSVGKVSSLRGGR